MAATFNQPQPNTIEALDDAGLEGIRANFEVLFRQSTQATDAFSASLAALFGTVAIQLVPIPAADGGTGLTSYTIGDIIFASAATTLSRLADVATGNVLISGGVGAVPSWGKIGLTTHISGTLPVANGGTNITSFTTGDLIYASGSTTLSKLADVAVNQVLVSGGVGAAPAWSATPTIVGLTVTTGNVGIGGAAASVVKVHINGTWAPGGSTVYGLLSEPTISLDVNADVRFSQYGGQVIKAASGTHPQVASLRLDPVTLTSGSATITKAANLHIPAAPSIATTNYAIQVDAGDCSFGGQILGAVGSGAAPSFSFASDPDTGIFSGGANDMRFSAAGSAVFNVTAAGINWIGASNGPSILNETPTATNPVFTPYGGDSNSGLGSDGTGVSLIAGATEMVKLTSTVSTINGAIKHPSSIAPAGLTSNPTNDYNPTGIHSSFILAISATNPLTLTGINAGTDGEMHMLFNSGASTITIAHDATSTSANRFYTSTPSGNIGLLALESMLIVYYNSRWHVIGDKS